MSTDEVEACEVGAVTSVSGKDREVVIENKSGDAELVEFAVMDKCGEILAAQRTGDAEIAEVGAGTAVVDKLGSGVTEAVIVDGSGSDVDNGTLLIGGFLSINF